MMAGTMSSFQAITSYANQNFVECFAELVPSAYMIKYETQNSYQLRIQT
jgi:hypothetical protein